jgi:hypothetical protein
MGVVESMRLVKTVVAILVITSAAFVTEATAQTPPAEQQSEKIVKGEVRSIAPDGTSITLMDGTELVTPPGVSLRPGALAEGMAVIASYREENGAKVMTELALDDQPSASPPANRRSPTEPSPAPSRGPSKL